MIFEYKHLLPQHFDPQSKVWIYQSSRLFAMSEALQIEEILHNFVGTWNSHGTPVKGYANLLFGQFIIFIADESATTVSGCSTDSSVHIIKQLETACKVSLFDRQSLAFVVKDKLQIIPLQQLEYSLQNNFLTIDTLYFNNTVLTLQALQTEWLVPIKNSWLAKVVSV